MKTNKSLSLLSVIAGLIYCPAIALAQPSAKWQHAGWGGGGYYYCAAYHPTQNGVMYMGGDVNGVYKTTDHGETWRIINNGIAGYGVFSLAIDAKNPQTVFAATEDGLCKSVDSGEHWTTLPQTAKKQLRITGEKGKSIRCIAVDPSDGNIVYAASPNGKVYKTLDGGQTWAVSFEKTATDGDAEALRVQYGKVNAAFFGGIWIQFAFPAQAKATDCLGFGFTLKGDGSKPKDSFLLLKTAAGADYRSKNLNELYQVTEWRDVLLKAEDFAIDPDFAKKKPELAATLPPTPDWSTIVRMDLACSGPLPTNATVAKFKRFFFGFKQPGSADVQNGSAIVVRDFAADKVIQSYGNIQLGAALAGPAYSVAIAPKKTSRVIAATRDYGLVLSDDAGQTWTELTTPKKAASATFDPADANVIYGAFFEQGIQKSTDGGKTWTSVTGTINPSAAIKEIAVSPTNPLDVYAIGQVDWTGVFYLSNDGGQTWKGSTKIAVNQDINPTLDGNNDGYAILSAPTNIILNPHNPKEIFLSANWRPCLSLDGGQTWTEKVKGADISCVTDIRFLNGKTYVTAMDEGTLVSANGGQTWRQVWPLKHTTELSGHNWRVAISGAQGSEQIVSTASPWSNTPVRIIRSSDGGRTSQVITAGLPDYIVRPNTMWGQGHPRALCADPKDPNTLYLGIDGDPADGKSGGGIFRSTNGGTTWTQLPSQPGSRRMYFGLAVDPTDSKRIFWAGCGNGGGVYRTQDQGASWERVFSNESFLWNVVATADGTIYCSGEQLWQSKDHGTTWKQLTNFTDHLAMVGLEVHPRDPKTIWVSTTPWDLSARGAIHKSTDGGETWQNITGDIPHVRPQVLRFNPATNELWAGYVGLYKLKQ